MRSRQFPSSDSLRAWSNFSKPRAAWSKRKAYRSAHPPHTALAAFSDTHAGRLLAACRQYGIRVPEDLSIVAMDEHPVAAHTNPPLTTIEMPLAEMGAEAAYMLIDAVEGAPVEQRVIATAPRLVVRATTAPPQLAT